ncbi:MAG: dehydratase [Dehalococcoidia bacterium]|nr:dehydratase [Dehalococcoidia bacterium]
MTSETQVEFDRAVLGKTLEIGPFPVTREHILAFTRAVGETNPLYTDDEAAREAGHDSIIAPPTFVNVFIIGSKRPDPKIQHGTLSFLASQALECCLSVKPGDTLRLFTSLEDVYAKTGRAGTMVFAVWKTEVVNQKAEVVAVARESFVRR